MSIDTKIDLEKGEIVHTISGEFSMDEIIHTVDEFWSTRDFPENINVIWDARNTTLHMLTSVELRQFAERTRALSGKMNKGRTAVVVSRDVDFGLARIFEAYLGKLDREVQIFRDVNNAYLWLHNKKAE